MQMIVEIEVSCMGNAGNKVIKEAAWVANVGNKDKLHYTWNKRRIQILSMGKRFKY